MLGTRTIIDVPCTHSPESFARALKVMPQLRRFGIDDQPLTGRLGSVCLALPCPLTKLSLINTNLRPADIDALASSRHASTLRLLRLDRNDLHVGLGSFLGLVQRLTSIVVIQTRNCQLTADDALRIADSVGRSRTVRAWSLVYNYVHSLDDLRKLLKLCSKSCSIREVACRPAEFQLVCGRLFMHNKFMLSEQEKDDLASFGESLNINVL